MDLGFILFAGSTIFALHWYLKRSALNREKELRRSLELCFTLDEQYEITREMYRRNLEVPNALPPLLGKANENTQPRKTYFVQEKESKKFVRLYGSPDEIDEKFDALSEAGACTTLHPEMYNVHVAALVRHESGKDEGEIKIFERDTEVRRSILVSTFAV